MRQVASLEALAAGTMRTVEIGETKILLVRDGDAVRAFSATCPHAGAPLEQGAICEGRLVCPWHKAMFAVSDGALLEPPALWPLARYPVRIEGDAVLVSAEPVETPAPVRVEPDARVMVVVGAGAAGAAGVAALREFGFAGRIVLVGAEPGEPFDRTALSKFVLEGTMQPAEAAPLWPDGFLAEQGIERLHDRVIGIDAAARTLSLGGGGRLDYDAVLLAPGSVPRALEVPGGGGPEVRLLRTREDASAILAGLTGVSRVAIVGGSFIGLEAASALRQREIAVTVISPAEIPFEAVLGREIGGMLRRLHEANEVVFRGGARVAAIEAGAVRLENGESIPGRAGAGGRRGAAGDRLRGRAGARGGWRAADGCRDAPGGWGVRGGRLRAVSVRGGAGSGGALAGRRSSRRGWRRATCWAARRGSSRPPFSDLPLRQADRGARPSDRVRPRRDRGRPRRTGLRRATVPRQ